MKRQSGRVGRWVVSGVLTLPMFAFYSGCVTDVQVRDFARGQLALTLTNLVTSQITAGLNDLNELLTGPQVTDETIPNPAAPN